MGFKRIISALVLSVTGLASVHAVGDHQALSKAAPSLDPDVLSLALTAANCAYRHGEASGETLTVIDYSLPSADERMWVFDLDTNSVLFKERVAHGKNTGGSMAENFSNVEGSRQTSLGLFRTAETYYGSNGYSMRMDGLDPGFNDRARERYIVMHGAWYVNDDMVEQHGRIGRSYGCPALRDEIAGTVIDTIKDGSLVFAYYPDTNYLTAARMLNACGTDGDRIASNETVGASSGGAVTAP